MALHSGVRIAETIPPRFLFVFCAAHRFFRVRAKKQMIAAARLPEIVQFSCSQQDSLFRSSLQNNTIKDVFDW